MAAIDLPAPILEIVREEAERRGTTPDQVVIELVVRAYRPGRDEVTLNRTAAQSGIYRYEDGAHEIAVSQGDRIPPAPDRSLGQEDRSVVDDLIASGRVRLATKSVADLPPPVPRELSTKEVLDDLRADT